MSTADLTVMGDIEDAICARLKDHGFNAQEFRISDLEDADRIAQLVFPAVAVSFIKGDCRRIGKSFKVDGALFQVVILGRDTRGEKALRRAVYPLVIAAIQMVCGVDFYVGDPERREIACKALTPGAIRKVFESTELIAYSIDMISAFTIDAVDDDADATEVLTVGLKMYMKPENETDYFGVDAPDVSDDVVLTGE